MKTTTKTIPSATAEESMKNCGIVSDYLFVEDPKRDIRELSRAQKGKPLKIFPKAEFLRFAGGTFFRKHPSAVRCFPALTETMGKEIK